MDKNKYIHKSWKRLEILKYIMETGLDTRGYSFLTKDDLIYKISHYIKKNEIKNLEFLFNIKPTKNVPNVLRQMVTKKARKIINYTKILDLEYSGYSDMEQVKIDVLTIQPYSEIPSVKMAIKSWNEIAEDTVEYAHKDKYDLTFKDTKNLKKEISGLHVKKGTFIIDLS